MSVDTRKTGLKVAAALLLAGVGLSGCATKQYVHEYVAEQMSLVNTRITTTDGRVTDAISRADAAAAAAQAAAADARASSQRLDVISTRIDTLEQQRVTRGPRN